MTPDLSCQFVPYISCFIPTCLSLSLSLSLSLFVCVCCPQAESVDAPAQFVTTTFRPEFVSVAHKCYGIVLENKVSNIHQIEKVR